MSVLWSQADIDLQLLETIRSWLPQQRWFPAKDRPHTLTSPGGFWLPDQADSRIRLLLVEVADEAGPPRLIQVPLVISPVESTNEVPVSHPQRPAQQGSLLTTPSTGPVLIGQIPEGAVIDGPTHPALVAAWLDVCEGPLTSAYEIQPALTQLLSNEQSNTSMILSTTEGPVAVLKILRHLVVGAHPDVDVPRALTAQGWDGVPQPLAWLQGPLPTGKELYLGVAAELIADATDGFTAACAAAGDTSFYAAASDLGTCIVELHQSLLEVYGPGPVSQGADRAAALTQRFAWAQAQVPELGQFQGTIDNLCSQLLGSPAQTTQRIHGDLHLGQVLLSAAGWSVIDFEGEPSADLQARTRPDVVLRDVAGILRSFDYAAAVAGLSGADAQRWISSCRHAFLQTYTDGDAPDTALLAAAELDKALYEVVYEHGNRPAWKHIPWAGVVRLTAQFT